MSILDSKRILLSIFTACYIIISANAQEAVFAQYYMSPQHLNPAMIGVFQGKYRFNTNYRQQWGNTFSPVSIKVTQAGLDMRHDFNDNGDYIGIGVNALNDENGGDSRMKIIKGNFGMSYLKQMQGSKYRNASQYLVAAGQVGFGQHSLSTNGLWFNRQYDSASNSVNYNIATGELAPRSSIYMDVNIGALFYSTWSDNQSFYVGASMHHVTMPNISFLSNKKEVLRRRFTVHGGGEIPVNNELSVLPSAIMTLQGPSMWAMLGANARYTNHDWKEAAIRAGASFRLANKMAYRPNSDGKSVQPGNGILGDAITFTGMLEINKLLVGLSYDIHISNIYKPTNGRGAWELSLIYTTQEKRRVRFDCPKF
jgi:type IX secretion system PorP/SprF family membrane protein